jgi:hypothetical protein
MEELPELRRLAESTRMVTALGHVQGRAFIVAIAPFDQPMSYYQTDQAIRNVLY